MRQYQKYKRYLFSFLCLFVLCWLFPYTGDDWAWGSSIGLERLAGKFDNYNGRYFGNLVVLALTRSNFLKSAVMAFCLTGIMWYVQYLTKKEWSFYACALLLLFTPKEISMQAIVWTSGFSNYTVSIFLSLIYIGCIYWIFDNPEEIDPSKLKQSWLQGIFLILLGLCSSMIMEYLTLYNLLLSIFVVGYVFYRFRTVLIQHLCYLAGTALGTFLMFSNSAYAAIANGTGNYRTVPQSILGYLYQACKNYLSVIYQQLYMFNLALNLAILIALVFLYFFLFQKMRLGSKRQSKIAFSCILISVSFWMYSVLTLLIIGTSRKYPPLLVFEGFFTIAAALSVIIFSLIAAKLTHRMWKMLFLICSIVIMVTPLLFVTPIGPRCFFPSYVLFILFFVELCGMLPADTLSAYSKKMVSAFAHAGIAAALVFYLAIFSHIYYVANERVANARQKIAEGETTIELLELPYRTFLWVSTPYEDQNLAERFKLFYDLPLDITLVPVEQYSKSK